MPGLPNSGSGPDTLRGDRGNDNLNGGPGKMILWLAVREPIHATGILERIVLMVVKRSSMFPKKLHSLPCEDKIIPFGMMRLPEANLKQPFSL
jgi:hypothetical protein